jgi:hypothetical protein
MPHSLQMNSFRRNVAATVQEASNVSFSCVETHSLNVLGAA